MKCQVCESAAILHVTEMVSGNPIEYHVCETHFRDLDTLKSSAKPNVARLDMGALWNDAGIGEALRDPTARKDLAAYLLPALCLALQDANPAVRIGSILRLMQLGQDAQSVTGALRHALRDPDESVGKAAGIALKYLESVPTRF